MQVLRVQDFSCIKSASLSLSRVTVLIGPQASGKSLLSKLIYFFNNIVLEHRGSDELSNSLEGLKEVIRNRFVEWFPVSAWGAGKFKIEYELGPYCIRITRTVYSGSLSDNTRIWLSKGVEKFHSDAQKLRERIISRSKSEETSPDDLWEIRYRIDEEVRLLFDNNMGGDTLASQLFIPAGRSFFTSAGKAITAFEHARMFDPVTLAFGKRLANYRDRGGYQRTLLSKTAQNSSPLNQASDILGGKVVLQKGAEFLRTPDGRMIPFGSLSSGQQEMLPLLMILDSVYSVKPRGKRFVFIEEPEAHLFPTAQSRLIELFAAFVKQDKHNSLLITTHSPYVLSKINNLIFAGSLGKRKNGLSAIAANKVISSSFWLEPPLVSAYALQDGEANSILDEDGLIAADYLDDVSGSLAQEFDQLLDIEVTK